MNSNLQKRCAYCNNEGSLTREHIWPQGFIKRSNYGMRYSTKANKTFEGDLVIRDVCSNCNSGELSKLDAYACALYDTYFTRKVKDFEAIEFQYDFEKLTRWLLKIAYNAARQDTFTDTLFSQYAPIINCEHPCSPAFIGIFVGTIKPTLGIDRRTGAPKPLYCKAFRNARMVYSDVDLDDSLIMRYLLINSFLFSIIVCRHPTPPINDLEIAVNRAYGTPLLPDGHVTIPIPVWDTLKATSGIEKWPQL